MQPSKKESLESQYLTVKFKDLEISNVARANVQIEIGEKVIDFITDNFAQKDPAPSTVARVFSKTLIETKPNWTLADLDTLFKFVMLRRDLEEFSSVVKYGRPVTALVLLDWIKVYEEERRVIIKEERVARVGGKSAPEKVSVYVQEALSKIPKSVYTPPPNPLTQDNFKEELKEMIPHLTKTELKGLLENLKKENVLRQDDEGKTFTLYYYQSEIDMINKRLNAPKS